MPHLRGRGNTSGQSKPDGGTSRTGGGPGAAHGGGLPIAPSKRIPLPRATGSLLRRSALMVFPSGWSGSTERSARQALSGSMRGALPGSSESSTCRASRSFLGGALPGSSENTPLPGLMWFPARRLATIFRMHLSSGLMWLHARRLVRIFGKLLPPRLTRFPARPHPRTAARSPSPPARKHPWAAPFGHPGRRGHPARCSADGG